MPLFPSLFGQVEVPDAARDYRNPLKQRPPRVRRPAPRPTR
jgi:hypothetical protein